MTRDDAETLVQQLDQLQTDTRSIEARLVGLRRWLQMEFRIDVFKSLPAPNASDPQAASTGNPSQRDATSSFASFTKFRCPHGVLLLSPCDLCPRGIATEPA